MFSWKSSGTHGTFSLFKKNLRIDRHDIRLVDWFINLFDIGKWNFYLEVSNKKANWLLKSSKFWSSHWFSLFFSRKICCCFSERTVLLGYLSLVIVIVKCCCFMSNIIIHIVIDNFTKERKHFIYIHFCKWQLAEKVIVLFRNMINIRFFKISNITLLWWRVAYFSIETSKGCLVMPVLI